MLRTYSSAGSSYLYLPGCLIDKPPNKVGIRSTSWELTSLPSVLKGNGPQQRLFSIDGIVLTGARKTLAAALVTEVNCYVAELAHQANEGGHWIVVRKGCLQPRRGPLRSVWWR